MEKQIQIDKEVIDSLGLDFQKITLHQKKIYKVLQGKCAPSLPILDVCSIENKEVIGWELLKKTIKNNGLIDLFDIIQSSERLNWIYQNVITCIPAAGAAARYWNGANSDFLNAYAKFPKALLPTTLEGDTFLDIKLLEQEQLMPTHSNVMIVPLNNTKKFQSIISERTSQNWLVLEQAQQLSTIRFQADGKPYILENQMYSPVPAGHGELVNLFDDITNAYPTTCALHFRNIDNIIGIQREQIEEFSFFAESFYLLRAALDVVRKHVTQAIDSAESLRVINEPSYLLAVNFLNMIYPSLLPNMDCQSQSEQKNLLKQLNKPLSVFGVVQKQSGDSGGGPVFVKTHDGKKVKICLEMPHANEHDRVKYFSENGCLLYFNPVLVFFETQTGLGVKPNFKEFFDDNFWLLSKRPYLNTEVFYHETVLYELIGNSEKTNLVFIEVPRTLFKPHKYFLDSIGKSRSAYGLNK